MTSPSLNFTLKYKTFEGLLLRSKPRTFEGPLLRSKLRMKAKKLLALEIKTLEENQKVFCQ